MTAPRTVTVTGHGVATVVPDSAMVRVSAVHRAAGVAEALSGVSASAERIGDVARERGLMPGSTGLSVWPWHDQESRPGGFEARHSLAVRCPTVAEAGDLLSALADAVGDALVVDGVSLDVSDPSDARSTAAEAAWDDARAHAAHLAALAGAELGDVVAIAEGMSSAGGPVVAGAQLGARLEPGESAVQGALTVTWALA
ncbi:SIMPL domain-containing protein [Nocardioides sp. Soil805]|uniref:SIMPL domain-containing protein n=1 Tax=Nocardioides sp. Soil805 TaxID=1736416 RepID=UPI000702F424|nr:SIMPL domain-containing protein [Nocardioides sp. Soil805]KRF36246.1 hypothetical protein ASG94_01865 [Nocardioides sp. Soil805]